MKNTDNKSAAKSARKFAAAEIETTLLAALGKVATTLGKSAKHFQKEVEKGSKRLAKKLSKAIEFDEPAKPAAAKTGKVVNGAEKPKAAAKAATTAPAAAPKTAPVAAQKTAPAAKPAPVTKSAAASKTTPAVGKAQPKGKAASKPAASKPKTT